MTFVLFSFPCFLFLSCIFLLLFAPLVLSFLSFILFSFVSSQLTCVCRGFFFFFLAHFYFPASGQAVVKGVVPSPRRFLPSIFIADRVQQSRCSSISHRALLTHALALFTRQFMHEKKSQRIYTSMHSAGLELTKLT